MTIQYQLTETDFYESFLAHRNGRSFSKWLIRAALACLVLGILANIWMYFTNHLKGSLTSALTPLVLVILMWLFILWGMPRWTAKNQFTKQPSAQGPRTLTLDEDGVHWRWNGGSADIEWHNLIRFYEAKNQILLYSSPACFNIIPKRALSPEELQDLRAVLEQKIAKK